MASTLSSPAQRRFRRVDSAPVAADDRVTISLPARPENIAVARYMLGAFGRAYALPEELLEDIRLAVTEACTNVVRHAYGDGERGTIDLEVDGDGDSLRITVSDSGRGMGPSPDSSGPGLGLPLIAAIADTVEIQHAPGAGSRVAMSFARRPREAE